MAAARGKGEAYAGGRSTSGPRGGGWHATGHSVAVGQQAPNAALSTSGGGVLTVGSQTTSTKAAAIGAAAIGRAVSGSAATKAAAIGAATAKAAARTVSRRPHAPRARPSRARTLSGCTAKSEAVATRSPVALPLLPLLAGPACHVRVSTW